MKLAVITSGFLPIPATKGGAVENLLVNLINENEKELNNMNLYIYSIFEEEAVKISKRYKNCKIIYMKNNAIVRWMDKVTFYIAKNILKKENSQSYRYIFQRLHFLNQISKDLKKNNYDKVLMENHPTQYLALKWRENYIKYENNYYYHCHNEFLGTYGCESIIQNTKKIICVSEYIKSTLIKTLNLSEGQCTVLRNGIDTEKFAKEISDEEKDIIKKKYNICVGEKVLLYTGRIVPEKGVKELLESLKNIKNNNYKLLIVGAALNSFNLKTKYQEEIEKMVKDLDNKVVFTGYINYETISKIYNIADIAVIPSIWDDPAPLTVIESLVSGLPIITTNSGGIPEYATNGSAIILDRNGELVKEISDSIDDLINNEEKIQFMSSMSKLVSSKLTTKEYYNNFCNIMSE